MATKIFIWDHDEHEMGDFIFLNEDETIKISKESAKHSLQCLSFLDYVGYTVFNNIQIEEIKIELQLLRKDQDIQENLKEIEKIILQIPKDNAYYLVFEGE